MLRSRPAVARRERSQLRATLTIRGCGALSVNVGADSGIQGGGAGQGRANSVGIDHNRNDRGGLTLNTDNELDS